MNKSSLPFSSIKLQASVALSRFTLEIVQADSEQKIFALLAEKLPLILPADRCSVTLLSDNSQTLEIFALHGSEGALSIGKFLPVDNSFAGSAVLNNQTAWHSDFSNNDEVDAKQLTQQNIKSCMNSPLVYSNRKIGTVNVGSSVNNAYNEDSAQLLSLVTKLVSSYLERQNLLKDAELGVKQYKNYSLELEQLAHVAQKLSSATSEQDVFKIITESVNQIVSAQRISYATFDEEKQAFKINVIYPNEPAGKQQFMPVENTALWNVYQEGTGQFFENLSSSHFKDLNFIYLAGFESSWSSPVKINNKVVGLLNAASSSAVEKGAKKLSVLNMLSGLLGVTLARVKLQHEIEYQASYDVLTGLPNRNQLSSFMDAAIAKDTLLPFIVLFIDLDRFKNINDTLGHLVGDKLLQQVTLRIQKQVRKNDFCARHGGDEFVAILTDSDSIDVAKNVAKKIIEAIKLPFIVGEYSLHIGASIGVSFYPFDSEQPEELLKFADIAMYFVKQHGRNNYQLYSNHLSQAVEYQQVVDNLLRQAISKNEFSLVYQPIISGDQVIGIESLLRWNNHELSDITPDIFIPIAEESLLIEDITAWVLNESCKTIKQLRKLYPELYISVNISAKDCLNTDKLKSNLLSGLAKYELPGEALELEITENVFIDDIKSIEQLFEELKTHGIRFAIDDFGTGFSSLTYLLSLPFNTLKIDQSFIRQKDKNKLGVVKSIIDIAESLSMHCIAEGIETIEQKQSLESFGCCRFQGYYFSRPLALNDLLLFLNKAT